MSAASNRLRFEEQFQCAICLDVFTDPVTTPCGHNFCKNCIAQHWNTQVKCNCPLCKELFCNKPRLKVNTLLSGMIAQFRQEAEHRASSSSEQQAAGPGEVPCDLCTGTRVKAVKSCGVCLHSYCETHLKPHLTRSHLKKHQLMEPMEDLEARMCPKHQRPLEMFCINEQTSVCPMCAVFEHKTHKVVLLSEYEEQKMGQRKTDEDVEVFNALVEYVEGAMKQLMDRMDQEEEAMGAQLKGTVSKELKKLSEPELKRKQQFAVDVTLDPDTAHPKLILSDDGKRVSLSDVRKPLPDYPKRFSSGQSVLGRQSFSSGKFYFEVQVKGKTEWVLGVCKESVNRKGKITLSPDGGLWVIWLRNGNEYIACENRTDIDLSLRSVPEKVGVFVDYEEGLVSFYDVGAAALIYSYTGCRFSDKLIPFFCPCRNYGRNNSAPLIICSVNQTV